MFSFSNKNPPPLYFSTEHYLANIISEKFV